jgi:hypothetical protein
MFELRIGSWLNQLSSNAQVTRFFDGTYHVAEMMNAA